MQVVTHDQRRLHEQTRHADRVGADFECLFDHLGDGDFDTEVVHLVTVVGQDDVDEVLADVVHVAFDRGEHEPTLAATTGDLLHVRLEIGNRSLHRLG